MQQPGYQPGYQQQTGYQDPGYQPPPQQVPVAPDGRVVTTERRARGLRVFQLLAAAAGTVLFVMGIIAVFRVDFGAGFLDVSGSVGGFGFSPAMAIAAIVLGGATMVAALADQDRGSTAVIGLLTLLAGIAALVLEGEAPDAAGIDRRSALLFVVLGAVVFVLSLVPWWSARRSTYVR
jgi:hypothetical protein